MKMKKLIIGSVLAAAVACTACAFAACGDNSNDDNGDNQTTTATVVAEGTGYGEWGQGCYVLYQEYSDGSVLITGAWTEYDTSTGSTIDAIYMLTEFQGSVEKGVDDDGDPYVELTVSTYQYTDINHVALSGDIYEAAGIAGTLTYEYDPFRTNDYNTTTGVYTIGFAINELGYYKINYTITVSPVTAATDVDAWVASHNTGSGSSTDTSGNSGTDTEDVAPTIPDSIDESQTIASLSSVDGGYQLDDGYVYLTLKSDGSCSYYVSLSSYGSTGTAEGTWSISDNIITLNFTAGTYGSMLSIEITAGRATVVAQTTTQDSDTVYGLPMQALMGSDSWLYYTEDTASSLTSLLSSNAAD